MPNLKNTVDDKTEQAVIDCVIAYIAILPMDNTEPVMSSENKVFVSGNGVRCIWLTHGL